MKNILFCVFLFVAIFASASFGASRDVPFPGLQAVYLRPDVLSEDAVSTYMRNIAESGAREVFLEVGYNNGVLNHSQIFPAMDAERDWLKALVAEAKKNGLKVHAWVKICFWVHKPGDDYDFPILKEHPEWIDLNRKGEAFTKEGTYEEKFFIFVNPAAPGVMTAILDHIRELCAYDIDGVSIDYIRFKAASEDPERWFGYNPYSVEQFKKQTGIDPLTIKPSLSPGSPFMKWVAYNEQIIEDCVRQISECMREINARENRSLVLSASPFTGYKSGESSKFQNWKPWDEKGYINLWLPMCMSIDMKQLEDEINGIKLLGLHAPYYPIVYPNQHGSLHPPMKGHHDVLQKCGISQFAVFQYKQLMEDVK